MEPFYCIGNQGNHPLKTKRHIVGCLLIHWATNGTTIADTRNPFARNEAMVEPLRLGICVGESNHFSVERWGEMDSRSTRASIFRSARFRSSGWANNQPPKSWFTAKTATNPKSDKQKPGTRKVRKGPMLTCGSSFVGLTERPLAKRPGGLGHTKNQPRDRSLVRAFQGGRGDCVKMQSLSGSVAQRTCN